MTDTTDSATRPPSTNPGGPAVDESAELQTDDFGISGTLTDQVADALERRWSKDATLTPEEDVDGTADASRQPDPTTPATSPTLDDGVGGTGVGGDAQEGAAPVDGAPPVPAATPSTESELDLNTYARDYFGTNLTPQQARELFAVFGGISALTPEKRAHLDAVLSGGGQEPASGFVTGDRAEQQYTSGSVQPQYPLPTQPVAPGQFQRPGDHDPDGQLYFDQYIAPLAAQQQQLRDEIARTTQVQVQQQQARDAAEINNAVVGWKAQHADLSDAEYARIEDNLIRSGILNNMVNIHGSFTAATSAALDQMFWADPILRERAIANVASGRTAGSSVLPDPTSQVAQQQQSDDAQRLARASSLSGSGGGAVTREPSNVLPKDPTERRKLMMAELAAGMDPA